MAKRKLEDTDIDVVETTEIKPVEVNKDLEEVTRLLTLLKETKPIIYTKVTNLNNDPNKLTICLINTILNNKENQ